MEMAARVSARAPDDPSFDLLGLLRGPFEAIGLAKVSTSAEEARDLGYLRPSDTVSMARETLIADAKQMALGLARAGYRPPPPRHDPGGGRVGRRHPADRAPAPGPRPPGQRARLQGGGQGGPRAVRRRRRRRGAWSASSYLLDLEREAFLSLCGEEKTRARIQHMLSTGKPLRN